MFGVISCICLLMMCFISTLHSASEFYTLLVNFTQPKLASSTDFYVYRNITCHQCPYGGRCQNRIEAVPNFWGYPDRNALDRVRFQRCQRGYCSTPGSECRGMDCCHPNRAGVLCGVCRTGYSEAMFTSDCIQNALCDPLFGWPVMVSSGILYFIFLL